MTIEKSISELADGMKQLAQAINGMEARLAPDVVSIKAPEIEPEAKPKAKAKPKPKATAPKEPAEDKVIETEIEMATPETTHETTRDDVIAALSDLQKATGSSAAVKGLLADHDAKGVAGLDPDKYAAVVGIASLRLEELSVLKESAA